MRNWRLDVIKDLEEQVKESIYLSAQEQLFQHGIENKVDEVLEVGQGSHNLLNNVVLKDEMLIIIENDIIDFKNKQIMH